jgi:hypothetical protein
MVTRSAIALAALLVASPTLAAEPIEFSTTGPAVDIARTLMSEERGEPLHDDEIVSVGLVDLDGDGTRDILAFADASYFCGTAGCIPRLYLLNRDVGRWSELPIETGAFINGEPSQWAIAGKNASGWTDLVFTSSDVRLVLSWNGTAYSN